MSNDFNLMFLAAQRFENGEAFRGAFLITDSDTTPLEFRCTSPVRPSNLQKTLYGRILEQHILINLIGLPLIRSSKNKFNLILVRDPLFLELRPQIDIPLLRIFKDTEDDSVTGEKPLLIASDSGKFEPVLMAAHHEFVDEREIMRASLSDIFQRRSLLEPFERISIALNQVHDQKVGE